MEDLQIGRPATQGDRNRHLECRDQLAAQAGCIRSRLNSPPSLWTVERLPRRISIVRSEPPHRGGRANAISATQGIKSLDGQLTTWSRQFATSASSDKCSATRMH